MRRTRLVLGALVALSMLGIAWPDAAGAQIVVPPPLPVLQVPAPEPAAPPAPAAANSAPAPAAPAHAALPALPAASGGGRRVVYSNSAQRVWLVGADGVAIDSWLVSGRRGVPRPGSYSVFSRSPVTTGQGGNVTMQYMVRFARGRTLAIGFHSIPLRRNGSPIQSVEQLGTFRSAGCVRQRVEDAAKMWEFAGVGTPVVVVA
jgi:lipoprotein-anchoring transpeptidase ErfK/SrfK